MSNVSRSSYTREIIQLTRAEYNDTLDKNEFILYIIIDAQFGEVNMYAGVHPIATMGVNIMEAPGETLVDVNNTDPKNVIISSTDELKQAVIKANTAIQSVTKESLGLGNVDNTSDINKPISTAVQIELNKRYIKPADGIGTADLDINVINSLHLADTALQSIPDATATVKGIAKLGSAGGAARYGEKDDIGLGNVDNTSDINKPISTAVQTALDGKEDKIQKGAALGYAPLDSDAKIPLIHIPSMVLGQMIYAGSWDSTTGEATLTNDAKTKLGVTTDTIILTNDRAPVTGYSANQGNYYIVSTAGSFAHMEYDVGDWLLSNSAGWTRIDNSDAVTGVKGDKESTYRLGNVNITPANIGAESALPAGTISQYLRGDRTWNTMDKSAVGLSNVDNTSDANKPISNAAQTALDGKAPLSHVGVGGVAQHPLGNGTTPGFSTSDFTAAEKSKLSGIAAGATANTGTVKIVTAGTGLSTSGDPNVSPTISHAQHTGEVTGTTSLTIASNAVSNAKMAAMGAYTLKGNYSAGGAAPQDLAVNTVKVMLALQNVTNESKATMFYSPSFKGTPTAPSGAADYGTFRLRNIAGGTSDLVPGVSRLASGDIYLVFE